MVFGGAMHPDQDAEHPWLQGEVAFIERAVEAGVPTIGVCLGAQLLARAAGAWIGPAGSAEVGWFSVELNDDGAADPVIGVLPRRVDAFQWHYYTFELPEGAVELARSEAVRQAFRLGERAWGIQFHAEVDRRMLDRWFREGAAELPKPVEEIRAETDRLLGGWNEQGRALSAAFLDEARRVASRQPEAARL
jgi:GMP synthase (glutamine-hydrolysing)